MRPGDLVPVHAGEPDVAEHDVRVVLARRARRPPARRGPPRPCGRRRRRTSQSDSAASTLSSTTSTRRPTASPRSARARRPRAPRRAASGRRTVSSVPAPRAARCAPRPCRRAAPRAPSRAAARARARRRERASVRSPCTNGSKTWSRSAASMPVAGVADRSTAAPAPPRASESVTRPPRGVNFAEFCSRFPRSCARRVASPSTRTGLSGDDDVELDPARPRAAAGGRPDAPHELAEVEPARAAARSGRARCRETSRRSSTIRARCPTWRATTSRARRAPSEAGSARSSRYDRAADRRERVAQLVREHGEVLVLAPIRLAQRVEGVLSLGDVADRHGHEPAALRGDERDGGVDADPAAAGLDVAHPELEVVDRLATQRAGERPLVRGQRRTVRPARLRSGARTRRPASRTRRPTQPCSRRPGGVHRQDVAAVVEDDDRLVDRVDDVAQLRVAERARRAATAPRGLSPPVVRPALTVGAPASE